MATRLGYLQDNNDTTYTGIWENLTDTGSFTVGSAMGVARFGALLIQVVGTFGGATVTIQVSNDGTTWATAKNPQGTNITFTATGYALVAGNPTYIRPSTAAGSSMDLDVYLSCSSSTQGADLIVADTFTTLVNTLNDYNERVIVTATAAIMTNGLDVFTVTGGPIRIMDLFSFCESANDGTASTMQWRADGSATGQAATTFSGASASLASFAAGGVVYNNFTTLATAPVITQTAGVFLWGPTTSTGGGVVVPAGVIDLVIGTGSTTGTWRHYMRYVPLYPNATVTAAF